MTKIASKMNVRYQLLKPRKGDFSFSHCINSKSPIFLIYHSSAALIWRVLNLINTFKSKNTTWLFLFFHIFLPVKFRCRLNRGSRLTTNNFMFFICSRTNQTDKHCWSIGPVIHCLFQEKEQLSASLSNNSWNEKTTNRTPENILPSNTISQSYTSFVIAHLHITHTRCVSTSSHHFLTLQVFFLIASS